MRAAAHIYLNRLSLMAAIVLVLQSVFTAWAAGAMPLGAQLDVFGNPLCITSIDKSGSIPSGNHPALPDCCAPGCNMGSLLLPLPADGSVHIGQAAVVSHVVAGWRKGSAPPAPDHDPGSPRAPPPAA